MEPSVQIFTNEYWPREVKYSVLKFSGGEIQVRLLERGPSALGRGAYASEIKGTSVTLITNITSSDILMEVLNLTDALRRLGVKSVSLTSKYFPYARQDRVCYPGESLSVKVVADIINAQHYDNVRIYDAHSDVTPALLNNVENVPCTKFVSRVLERLAGVPVPVRPLPILVAPDAGAAKKVMTCAKELKCVMVTAEKVRDSSNGAILRTKVEVPFEHVNERDFLMVDDICDGGRTFIELAKELRKVTKGKIYLYVTHGIFSAGFDELRKHVDHIYTPNSLHYNTPTDFVSVL